jgi:Flp pilus assembly pilin Flp
LGKEAEIVLKKLKAMLKSERGYGVVEWIVIATLVAGMAVGGATVVYKGINTAAGTVNTNLNSVVTNSGNASNVTW